VKHLPSPYRVVAGLALAVAALIVVALPARTAVQPAPPAEPAGDHAGPPAMEGPLVAGPAAAALSRPARELPPAKPEDTAGGREDRRKPPLASIVLHGSLANILGPRDPLLGAPGLGSRFTPTPTLTFDGHNNTCNCSPPDPIGDVGPNHYVQMVNATTLNVYDKNGVRLLGPVQLRTLWSSGNCANSSRGDPVVIYDGLADRWLLAQFSTVNAICVALSQSGDPTGSYHTYEFATPTFPDYFKIAVWPDAYYVSANESSYSAIALERPQMLVGGPARSVRFAGQTNFLLAADIDGPTPPAAGEPAIFYTFKDDSYHGGTDRLELFDFHVDWGTPANSTFTLAQSIPVTPFTYTVCGFFNFNCIPQLDTTQRVDAVSEWPMWRFVYRKFPGHETLLGNFAIDVGSDQSGIRWFELRSTGGNYALHQEGTHAPDANHRFMGSIAMDRQGNIALAYSISSSTMYPGLRHATRLASDPPGTLQPEAEFYPGSGSQTGSNRWGDYSALSVDPVDDCTFWYTGEYYQTSSSNGWRTRIGRFKIPTCTAGTPTPTVTGTLSPTPTATRTPTRTNTPTATACVPGTTDYGYTATTGTITAGVTDIGNHCDDCVTNIALPFPVMLYDQSFSTSINVSSNGPLQFSSAISPFTNACLPNASHNNTIFGYWDDLRTDGAGQGIFTTVVGSAPNRTFVIEWRAGYFSGGGTANFEVLLHENSPSFETIYGTVTQGNASSTVGVQRDTGSRFTQYACNGSGGAINSGLRLNWALIPCGTPTVTATLGPPTTTPTATASASPTATDTPVATATGSPTATDTPAATPTETATPEPPRLYLPLIMNSD
jgi:hypothetical protein